MQKPEKGPPPGTPSCEEIQTLIAAAHKLRDKIIIRLFYATGLRLAELLNLRCVDIDLQEHRVFVRHGKGDKDRYTLIDPETVRQLQAYKPQGNPGESVFNLRSGNAVESMVRKLAQETGIGLVPITVHQLNAVSAQFPLGHDLGMGNDIAKFLDSR